jgi:outer membrane lipoprotein SlyB
MRSISIVLVVALITTWSAECLADPPAHAPAHGWRKKHDPQYVGYTGTQWERDYAVSSGHCNREEVGAVIGGVAGGVIGSKVASPEQRVVGIIIGAAAGALIGAKIGRELDDGDRGCFGHTLEIAQPGARVTWENHVTGVRYALVPGEGHSGSAGTCRDFVLEASARSGQAKRAGRACQQSPGVWKVM